jgi:cyclophilin family peptidyl-prolyl cis-trans isomerase
MRLLSLLGGGFQRAAVDRLRRGRDRASSGARPRLEVLEDRSVPSAVAPGALSGLAFIDHNGNGVFDSGEVALPGLSVTLTGTTSAGQSVNASAVTDAGGVYVFQNVRAGTYSLSSGTAVGLLGGAPAFSSASAAPGVALVSGLGVGAGQALGQNLGFLGLSPASISLTQFLSTTTAVDFPNLTAPAGAGTANLNQAPVVSSSIADVSAAENSASIMIDLAAHFSDPDITNSTLTFNTNQGALSVQMFDTTAPQTVANFYDYVNSGAYDNAVFTRLVSGFVLQGGGASLQTSAAGSSLEAIATLPAVPNEFSDSNLTGTLALAQSAGDPNSGTNQFFFNLADNSSTLDPQKFTVFGQVASAADQSFLNSLAVTPTRNESSSAVAAQLPAVDLQNVPLKNYQGTNFPTDATASNFLVINSITSVRNEALTYSVVANSNPNLVTASVVNERLTLSFAANQTGVAAITVRAADQFGAAVLATFNVVVNP